MEAPRKDSPFLHQPLQPRAAGAPRKDASSLLQSLQLCAAGGPRKFYPFLLRSLQPHAVGAPIENTTLIFSNLCSFTRWELLPTREDAPFLLQSLQPAPQELQARKAGPSQLHSLLQSLQPRASAAGGPREETPLPFCNLCSPAQRELLENQVLSQTFLQQSLQLHRYGPLIFALDTPIDPTMTSFCR